MKTKKPVFVLRFRKRGQHKWDSFEGCSFATLRVAREFSEIELRDSEVEIYKVLLNEDGRVIKDWGVVFPSALGSVIEFGDPWTKFERLRSERDEHVEV